MEESQLEEYRQRMREKYLRQIQETPSKVSIEPTPKPLECEPLIPAEPEPKDAISEVIKDQGVESVPMTEVEEVRPPLDIQKVERLVDFGNVEDHEYQPLIADGDGKRPKITCLERLKRDCGYRTWGSAWVIAGVLVIVVSVLVLVLLFYR